MDHQLNLNVEFVEARTELFTAGMMVVFVFITTDSKLNQA